MIDTVKQHGRAAVRTRPVLSIAFASLTAPVVLSLVASYQFATRLPDDYEWMLFGFHDKRWLITLYFAWFITFPVSLAAGLTLGRSFSAGPGEDHILQQGPDLASSRTRPTRRSRAATVAATGWATTIIFGAAMVAGIAFIGFLCALILLATLQVLRKPQSERFG